MANIASLGGTLPIINQGLAAARTLNQYKDGIFGDADTARRTQLRLDQLKERNRLEEDLAGTRTDRDTAITDAERAESERRRSNALKRAVSRQRATYGGAGVDSEGGSSEAVLLGLFSDSESERAASDNIYDLRKKIIADNFAGLKRRNLLEESQLATRLRVG
jgi:hypothetical protein